MWLVGGRGSVATTAVLGALAVRARLAPTTGLVSELPDVAVAGLVPLDRLVVGGHDTSQVPLRKRAEELAAQGVVPGDLVAALGEELEAVDAAVLPAPSPGPDQRARVEALVADLRGFVAEHSLARLVVVDVSSTQPPVPAEHAADLATPDTVRAAWDAGRSPLPPAAEYAWAAFEVGASVVAFTPSPGVDVPAVAALGRERGAVWAGSDGKTGETLLKSTLAPMFVQRALELTSWSSFNVLGGGDGRALSDPHAALSKTTTKAAGLEAMVGRQVSGPVRIDYVAELGDWKTAMNLVTFSGFLGTRMTLQFTWNGCDSALAAPLVLDLVRLLAACDEAGRTGPVAELGFFFKNPLGSDEHALAPQWVALTGLAQDLAGRERR
ncbi:inositol-3-phosphate synthase [Aquipuribacter sp. SD81]|uniref:inositol-3-phosphate synthase n=1 Tax=Aquipuribacter sp. SD81 TaxID=3127703 RepID=UPI00301A8D06